MYSAARNIGDTRSFSVFVRAALYAGRVQLRVDMTKFDNKFRQVEMTHIYSNKQCNLQYDFLLISDRPFVPQLTVREIWVPHPYDVIQHV